MNNGGRYIGSLYVMFDKNGKPNFNTYCNEFNGKNTKIVKNDLCNIITKNLENIQLETRIKIREKHVEHALRFSCFKTLESNPDRYDKSLYIFQIFTKSITTLGPDYGWSYANGEVVFNTEVKIAAKSAVDDMLVYLYERYG